MQTTPTSKPDDSSKTGSRRTKQRSRPNSNSSSTPTSTRKIIVVELVFTVQESRDGVVTNVGRTQQPMPIYEAEFDQTVREIVAQVEGNLHAA